MGPEEIRERLAPADERDDAMDGREAEEKREVGMFSRKLLEGHGDHATTACEARAKSVSTAEASHATSHKEGVRTRRARRSRFG